MTGKLVTSSRKVALRFVMPAEGVDPSRLPEHLQILFRRKPETLLLVGKTGDQLMD